MQHTSYAELDARARHVAGQLLSAGCTPGTRVAIWMDDGPALVELFHAALELALTLVPLNLRLTPAELVPLLDAARPRVLVFSERLASQAREAARRSGLASLSADELCKRVPEPVPDPAPHAPELILFTSGTTGTAKGARLGETSLAASVRAAAAHLALGPDDRWLACMPLYHIGGLSILLRAAAFGASVVLHPRFDAERVVDALERESITHLSLVPTMLRRLLDRAPAQRAPSSLRCVLLGGGAVAPDLVRRAHELGWPICATYGLTEAASQVATSAPGADPDWLPPLPGTELRVIDARGQALPPGEPGEVCVRGAQVMCGYLDAEQTAHTLRGGWLHTGDVGMLDARGRLRVLDRRSDLIVSGGENIYPAEVERVLESHPRIAEAGVVGLPDPEWGQRVVAVVVLRSPGDGTAAHAARSADAEAAEPEPDWSELERALAAHCADRLAGFKRPRALLRAREPLPRTASGKLRRDRLRQRIAP